MIENKNIGDDALGVPMEKCAYIRGVEGAAPYNNIFEIVQDSDTERRGEVTIITALCTLC